MKWNYNIISLLSTPIIIIVVKKQYWNHYINSFNIEGVIMWVMVFNATFNNISVISWLWVLVVEVTGENHRPLIVFDN